MYVRCGDNIMFLAVAHTLDQTHTNHIDIASLPSSDPSAAAAYNVLATEHWTLCPLVNLLITRPLLFGGTT